MNPVTIDEICLPVQRDARRVSVLYGQMGRAAFLDGRFRPCEVGSRMVASHGMTDCNGSRTASGLD